MPKRAWRPFPRSAGRRDAAEETEHAHMRAGSIRQLLRPGRLGISEIEAPSTPTNISASWISPVVGSTIVIRLPE